MTFVYPWHVSVLSICQIKYMYICLKSHALTLLSEKQVSGSCQFRPWSPAIIKICPMNCILFWIRLSKLFIFQGNEAIRYLEFCIENLDNKDQAIHNYLLSLYAKIKEDQLMTYLQMQGLVRVLFVVSGKTNLVKKYMTTYLNQNFYVKCWCLLVLWVFKELMTMLNCKRGKKEYDYS